MDKLSSSARDLALVAGLLEGEGCFGIDRRTSPRPFVSTSMTDLDVLERAQAITGVGTICRRTPDKKHPHYKPAWVWKVNRGADAAGLMMTVYPLMGARRQAKLRSILSEWRAAPISKYARKAR